MPSKPIAALLLALACASCGRDVEPEPIPADSALDVVAQENIEAHLNYLADDARQGRMAGQPGYDEAAAYVAQQFAKIGLEPGGEDGWYQPVPLIS